MFNLTNHTVTLGSTTYHIERFEVWFQSPMGLFDNIDLALEKCKSNDIDGEFFIAPVPVAIAAGGIYEVLIRR